MAEYSPPGGLVVDPMCGIGTTLVEATHLGCHAIGVKYEARWAELARANLAHAAGQSAPGSGRMLQGDARQLTTLLDLGLLGRVALVLTSPPYGSSVQAKPMPNPAVAWPNGPTGTAAARPGRWAPGMRWGWAGGSSARPRDLDQALGMLWAAMDADQVWPNVWFITDHGNPHRLDPEQP